MLVVAYSRRNFASAWCSLTVVAAKLSSCKEVANQQTGKNLRSETPPAKAC